MLKYVKVGKKGEITIPKEFREYIGIVPRTKVCIKLMGDEVVIVKK